MDRILDDWIISESEKGPFAAPVDRSSLLQVWMDAHQFVEIQDNKEEEKVKKEPKKSKAKDVKRAKSESSYPVDKNIEDAVTMGGDSSMWGSPIPKTPPKRAAVRYAKRIVNKELDGPQCDKRHIRKINRLLKQWSTITVRPSSLGIRISPIKKARTKSLGKVGRPAMNWTEEEKPVVEAMRKRIAEMGVDELLTLLKSYPLPEPQASEFPSKPPATLHNLFRDSRMLSDGQMVLCSAKILKMRAKSLLLKWAANTVSGRKIYY